MYFLLSVLQQKIFFYLFRQKHLSKCHGNDIILNRCFYSFLELYVDFDEVFVMKKKVFALVVVLSAMYFLFFVDDFNLFAREFVDEVKIEALVDDEIVVIHDGDVLNLGVFQRFYTNSLQGIEGNVYVVVDPYTRRVRDYELIFEDGRFILFEIFDEGLNYKVQEFDSLFRIFRNNEISFVLEGGSNRSVTLFGYSMN